MRHDPMKMPFPEKLKTDRFRSAWASWIEMRRERKFSVREAYLRRQLAFLDGLGERGAVESLELSTRNDYQGLFRPRGSVDSGLFRGPALFAEMDNGREG